MAQNTQKLTHTHTSTDTLNFGIFRTHSQTIIVIL
jgi:hypothetical protein